MFENITYIFFKMPLMQNLVGKLDNKVNVK